MCCTISGCQLVLFYDRGGCFWRDDYTLWFTKVSLHDGRLRRKIAIEVVRDDQTSLSRISYCFGSCFSRRLEALWPQLSRTLR